jgi:hypothetical protein
MKIQCTIDAVPKNMKAKPQTSLAGSMPPPSGDTIGIVAKSTPDIIVPKIKMNDVISILAEAVGFEPTVLFPVRRFSRPVL